MAALVAWAESVSGKGFTYGYDLPAEETVDFTDWQAAEQLRLETEAKLEILAESPEVEISISEAWEEIEINQPVETSRSVTRWGYNLGTEQIYIHTVKETVIEEVGTGQFKRRLKQGVRFDENMGKFYCQRTLDEVETPLVAAPQLPEWIVSRLPQ